MYRIHVYNVMHKCILYWPHDLNVSLKTLWFESGSFASHIILIRIIRHIYPLIRNTMFSAICHHRYVTFSMFVRKQLPSVNEPRLHGSGRPCAVPVSRYVYAIIMYGRTFSDKPSSRMPLATQPNT